MKISRQKHLFSLLEDEGCRKLVISLEHCDYIGSMTLATLFGVWRFLAHRDGQLKLCAVSPPVRDLFEMTHVDELVEIFNDRNEALRKW